MAMGLLRQSWEDKRVNTHERELFRTVPGTAPQKGLMISFLQVRKQARKGETIKL